MKLDRLVIFMQRFKKAQDLGFSFFGTSYFNMPRNVVLNHQVRQLDFPEDNTIAWDVINLWLDDEYGLETISEPVSTILDVGANVGLFSLWATRIFPQAKIHAYEPNPAVQTYFCKNVAGLQNVQLFDEGIALHSGNGSIELYESTRLTRTIADPHGGIKMCSLRQAVERLGGKVDLLKLDCEGAEWELFSDAGAFENIREIRMEYHLTDGRDIADLKCAADRIGFNVSFLQENIGHGIAYLEKACC